MLIYRLDAHSLPQERPLLDGSRCVIVSDLRGILAHFKTWRLNWGWPTSFKTALKVLSRRRILFFTLQGRRIVQSGWANIGFCRYYPVESNAVVLGTLYTLPDARNKGYSTAAKNQTIRYLYLRGHRRFYSDTTLANHAVQRISEKLGFQRIS